MNTDKHYLWHLAGAEDWAQDTSGSEYGYGSEGWAFGRGYPYTDSTSHGHYIRAGNGWGYSFADCKGGGMGGGAMYAY